MKPTDPCPCGTGRSFAQCCGAALSGAHPAPTAEALMRSRYTAFALRDTAYLLASWHTSTRPATLDLDETPPPKSDRPAGARPPPARPRTTPRSSSSRAAASAAVPSACTRPAASCARTDAGITWTATSTP